MNAHVLNALGFVALAPLTSLACACGGAQQSPATTTAPTVTAGGTAGAAPAIVSVASDADNLKVDKVGTTDGAFHSDGIPDFVLDVVVDGPVRDLFLVAVRKSGEPNGRFRADTMVGTQEAPSALGGTLEQGKFSAGIAVYENGKILNEGSGALNALAAGRHTLKIYVNDDPALGKGGHLRVYATTPDGTLVNGPTFDYGAPNDATPATSSAPTAPTAPTSP